jgi:hypothetical protein
MYIWSACGCARLSYMNIVHQRLRFIIVAPREEIVII